MYKCIHPSILPHISSTLLDILNSETVFLQQACITGKDLTSTEVTKVMYEFVRCFEFWKFFPLPQVKQIQNSIKLVPHAWSKHQWLRFHETFQRGGTSKRSAVSGLRSIAEKRVEIWGREKKLDRGYGVLESRAEGGGSRTMPGCFSNSCSLSNSVVIQPTRTKGKHLATSTEVTQLLWVQCVRQERCHQPSRQIPSPWIFLTFPAQPHCQFTITTPHTEFVRTRIRHHQLPKARPSHRQLVHISKYLLS